MTPTKATALALTLLLATTALVGCSAKWAETTDLSFPGLSASSLAPVQRALEDKGLLVTPVKDDKAAILRVRGIDNTTELAGTLKLIQRTLRDNRISAPFESAVLRFGDFEVSGSIYSTVNIEVSRGAEVFVADGNLPDPWRRVEPGTDGVFRGVVNTSRAVADLGGWLYFVAVRDGDTTYSRVNVLSGKLEQRIQRPANIDAPNSRSPGSVINRIFN